MSSWVVEHTKWYRLCIWIGWKSEIGELNQATEMWWMLENSEIGKASEINEKSEKLMKKIEHVAILIL